MFNWFYCHMMILWFKFINYTKEPSKFNLLDGSLVILFLIDLYLVYLYGIHFKIIIRIIFLFIFINRTNLVYKFYNFKGNILLIITIALYLSKIVLEYYFYLNNINRDYLNYNLNYYTYIEIKNLRNLISLRNELFLQYQILLVISLILLFKNPPKNLINSKKLKNLRKKYFLLTIILILLLKIFIKI